MWWNDHTNSNYPLIILGFISFTPIILVIFLLIRRRSNKANIKKTKQEIVVIDNNFDNFRDKLKNSKSMKSEREAKKICETLVFKGDAANESCSISRIPFKHNEIILRCPYCKKKYKEKYLADWLLTNDICPVCRVKLIVR
jgi:hypothetical protein